MKKKAKQIRRRTKKTAKKPKKILKRRKTSKKRKKTIKRHKKITRRHKKVRREHKKIAKRKKARRPITRRPIKRRKPKRRVKKSIPKTFVGKGILEQLFESRAKVKIMKLFFRNSEDVFRMKDILKMLRINSFTVRQEMRKLEKLGLIAEKRTWVNVETRKGRVRKQKRTVYCLNTEFDFFKELKDLILKSTISSKEELIDNIRKTGNIKLLILAGIFRGKDGAEADILVVGDKMNQRKFSTFLKDLEAEVGKELNCALMSSKEFNYRYDMYDRFVRDLISENSDVLINKLNLW